VFRLSLFGLFPLGGLNGFPWLRPAAVVYFDSPFPQALEDDCSGL